MGRAAIGAAPWRSNNACFPACSRPETCISATISARSSSSRCSSSYDCIYCVVDLHAITVPVNVWGGPEVLRRATREVTAAFIASGIDPKQAHRVQPEPGRRPRRARLGVQLRRPHGLAQPHDPVQGEGRQGPRERVRRPVRLSGADGGRHPGLSRDARAGRRGPEAASGALPRHRAEVQQRLRRVDRRARPRRKVSFRSPSRSSRVRRRA